MDSLTKANLATLIDERIEAVMVEPSKTIPLGSKYATLVDTSGRPAEVTFYDKDERFLGIMVLSAAEIQALPSKGVQVLSSKEAEMLGIL